MGERTFISVDQATAFASLMKKLCGQEMKVVQHGGEWAVRPAAGSSGLGGLSFGHRNIVEVTEALLRQVGK